MISNYFDHIYCINLDRRKDRWEEVSQEFSKVGVLDTVKRFTAIDGKNVNRACLTVSSKTFFAKRFDEFKQSSYQLFAFETIEYFSKRILNHLLLSNGEVGCLLSHIEIIKKAEKNNFESVLVFEDDVVFCDDFNEKLVAFMENVPPDWDMLYLGGNHNYHIGNIPEKVNDYVIRCNKTYATHALVIRSSLYQYILDINSLTKPIDIIYVGFQKKHNIYAPSVSIAKQRAGYSDIRNRRVDYENWIT